MTISTAIEIYQLSVHDYHQMIESGILAPGEHVELLEGQLIKMAPKGTAHSAAVSRVVDVLSNCLEKRALLRFQDPIQLNDYSEPEPDVAIVQPNPSYYEDHHPSPAEVFWLIEVSDTTLAYDCGPKALAYGRSGILEYWVLDINARKLHVYRSPDTNGYQSETILAEGLTIAPLSFPDREIRVGEFLRPA
ncbi:MAG: Uma2 family endonuclease [Leptolyngbyaceae cyanobacterium bins.59]|nr:Uma2 family endonuclease [Leptolyngbyaceae cyanobacterium bins.59]